jgi:hypothetical protein
MLRRFFQSRSVEHGKPWTNSGGSDPADTGNTAEPFQQADTVPASGSSTRRSASRSDPRACASFEDIYRDGGHRLSDAPYSILKVSEMIDSPHLAGMSGEAKRNALMMALEAAGADVEFVLKDAMLRQRALNDYEEEQRRRVKEFETDKANENRGLQAELDRITADYMRRMQATTDEVARSQDEFEAWQKRKAQELQRIEEAAAVCAHSGPAPGANILPPGRERSAVSGR